MKKRTCRYCGKQLKNDAVFCPYCGKAVSEGIKLFLQPRYRIWLYIVGAVLLTEIVFAVVIIGVRARHKKEMEKDVETSIEQAFEQTALTPAGTDKPPASDPTSALMPDPGSAPETAPTETPLPENQRRYEVVIGDLSWLEAARQAEAVGGHLVTFETPEEVEDVISLIEAEDRRDIRFYIGGYQDGNEYFWLNEDGLNAVVGDGSYRPSIILDFVDNDWPLLCDTWIIEDLMQYAAETVTKGSEGYIDIDGDGTFDIGIVTEDEWTTELFLMDEASIPGYVVFQSTPEMHYQNFSILTEQPFTDVIDLRRSSVNVGMRILGMLEGVMNAHSSGIDESDRADIDGDGTDDVVFHWPMNDYYLESIECLYGYTVTGVYEYTLYDGSHVTVIFPDRVFVQGKKINDSDNPIASYWQNDQPTYYNYNTQMEETVMELRYDNVEERFVFNDITVELPTAEPEWRGQIGYIVEYD